MIISKGLLIKQARYVVLSIKIRMFRPHRPPSDEKLGEYKREGGVNHSIILICLNLNLHHYYNTTFSLVLLPFSMFTAICRQQVGSEKRELSTCSTLSTTHTTL